MIFVSTEIPPRFVHKNNRPLNLVLKRNPPVFQTHLKGIPLNNKTTIASHGFTVDPNQTIIDKIHYLPFVGIQSGVVS